MLRPIPTLLALAGLCATTACGDDAGAATGAAATFTQPAAGARVAGAADVAMSATGITIGPAGEVVADTGHFHVIADHECVSPGTAIPKDADHVHVGSGAATAAIYLEPGTHTLCLQVGDGAHQALAVTDTIEIEVGVDDIEEWCDVVADVDSLFAAQTQSDEPFAAQKLWYVNAGRLLAQLEDGLDSIDPEARENVGEIIHWATVMVDTLLAAESLEAAEAALWGPESVLPTDDELGEAGSDWVRDTCGVSLD